MLEANKGLVSALAFSPDGLKLAAGDVSTFLLYFYRNLSIRLTSSALTCQKKPALACNFPCVGVLTLTPRSSLSNSPVGRSSFTTLRSAK